MRTFKSVFGVMRAIPPILYCGYLLYDFLDLGGSVQEAQKNGQGPTMLGLAAVSLLFCIPLIMKVVRMFARLRSPGPGGRAGPEAPPDDGESAFDADAAVARYLARKSAEAATVSPAVPPARAGIGPAARPSFGRKSR